MKKSLLVVLMLCTVFSINAQNDNDNEKTNIFDRNHEVRLGALKLLSGGIIEGSYEYVLDSNQGFGAHVLINLDSGNDYFENLSLTPYYRMYFQTNEDYGAKGFFVEGFTSFFTTSFNLEDSLFDENENKDVFDISIGLALGKKWINTAGFVFEIKLGAGRNLLGNADSDALLKGGFYIGYRF
jgi:hypothetical protein